MSLSKTWKWQKPKFTRQHNKLPWYEWKFGIIISGHFFEIKYGPGWLLWVWGRTHWSR